MIINIGCSAGTRRCSDGSCGSGATCPPTLCNEDTICDSGESCACSDCYGKQDSCAGGLACDSATKVCISNTPPTVRPATYTGSCTANGKIKIKCDATDANQASNTLTVKGWLGTCDKNNCFDTRNWLFIDSGTLAYESGNTFTSNEITLNVPSGTGISATCLASDSQFAESNYGDHYPICIVDEVASTPSFSSIVVTPSTVTSYGDVTITFTSVGSALKENPSVKITKKTDTASKTATFVSKTETGNTYTYQFTVDSSYTNGDYVVDITGTDTSNVQGTAKADFIIDISCSAGTRRCPDGSCGTTCTGPCNYDTVCNSDESCTCSDCFNQPDKCASGLVCNPTTQLCGTPEVVTCTPPKTLCADGICRDECTSCPVGTTLCSDLTCKSECPPGPCNKNSDCEPNENCDCSDCFRKPDSCGNLLVCGSDSTVCDPCIPTGAEICGNKIDDDCDNAIDEGCNPPCEEGTTFCTSLNSCVKPEDCPDKCVTDNGICDADEGCTCKDCTLEQDKCDEGLFCSYSEEKCVDSRRAPREITIIPNKLKLVAGETLGLRVAAFDTEKLKEIFYKKGEGIKLGNYNCGEISRCSSSWEQTLTVPGYYTYIGGAENILSQIFTTSGDASATLQVISCSDCLDPICWGKTGITGIKCCASNSDCTKDQKCESNKCIDAKDGESAECCLSYTECTNFLKDSVACPAELDSSCGCPTAPDGKSINDECVCPAPLKTGTLERLARDNCPCPSNEKCSIINNPCPEHGTFTLPKCI